MKLNDQIDFTTLNWVKQELDETLKQARQALEAFVDDPVDTSQMRFCATYLHQVQGTLRMVELYGAALVVEEMERVALGLLDGDVLKSDETYAVLMRGMMQLPDYLERLQGGHRDIPVVLLPLLNDLRATRGEKLLSENVLFSPDLSVALPESAAGPNEPIPEEKLRATASRLRTAFEFGLLKWFRDDDADEILTRLMAISDRLCKVTSDEQARRLWWVAGGVLEALLVRALDASVSVKLLFGRVDREIKRLVEEGEATFRNNPPSQLTKSLLYYAAHSQSSSERVKELKSVYRLNELLPDDQEVEHAQGSLAGRNKELLDTVSGAIKDDLLRVKDALDLHLRNSDSTEEDLQPLADSLDRVADTLGMLGLGVPRKVIIEQKQTVEAMASGDAETDENALLDVAGALLYVESSLDDHIVRLGQAEEDEASLDDVSTDEALPLPESETRRILDALMKEASTNLQQIKQDIVAFIEAPWDHDLMTRTPGLLEEIVGALRMLNLGDAAELLNGVVQYISSDLLEKRIVPEANDLDTLADAIASVEYYLEGVRERRPGKEKILEVARASLVQLRGSSSDLDAPPSDEEAEAVTEEVVSELDSLSSAPEASAEADHQEPPLADNDLDLDLDLDALDSGEADEAAEAAEHQLEVEAADLDAVATADEPSVEEEKEETAEDTTAAQTPAPTFFDDIDDEIREVFVEEFGEELDVLNDLYPKWKADVENQDDLTTIRRSFHTLKGSGRLVGATEIGEFSWGVESLLNQVLDGNIAAESNLLTAMDSVMEALPQLYAGLKDGVPVSANLEAISSVVVALSRGEDADMGLLSGSDQGEDTSEQDNEVEAEALALSEAVSLDDQSLAQDAVLGSAQALGSGDDWIEGEAVIEDSQSETADTENLDESDLVLDDVVDLPEADPQLTEAAEAAAEPPPFTEGDFEPIDSVLLGILRAEVDAHLGVVKSFVDEAQSDSQGTLPTEDLVRAVHTLNGAVAMVEVPVLSSVTAPLEGYIKRLSAAEAGPGDEGLLAMLESVEALEAAVPELESKNPDFPDTESVCTQLENLRDALPEPDGEPGLLDMDLEPAEELDLSAAEQAEQEGEVEASAPSNAPAWELESIENEPEPSVEGTPANFLADTELADSEVEETAPESEAGDSEPAIDGPDWELEAIEALDAVDDAGIAEMQADDAGVESVEDGADDKDGAPDWDLEAVATEGEDDVEEGEDEHLTEATDLSAEDETEAELADDAPAWSLEQDETPSDDQQAAMDEAAELLGQAESAAEEADDSAMPSWELEPVQDEAEAAEESDDDSSDEQASAESDESDGNAPDWELEATHDAVSDDPEEDAEVADAEPEASIEAQASDEDEQVAPDWELEATQEEVSTDEGEVAESADADAPDAPELEAIDEAEGVLAESSTESEESADSESDSTEESERSEDAEFESEPEAQEEAELSGDTDSEASEEEGVDVSKEAASAAAIAAFGVAAAAAADADADMPLVGEVDEELLEIFVQEGEEILDQTDRSMQRLRESPDDIDAVVEIQRELHTLKGGARMAGMAPIGNLSHAMESLLEGIAGSQVKCDEQIVATLDQSFDRLNIMVELVQARQDVPDASELIETLEGLNSADGEEPEAFVAETDQPITSNDDSAAQSVLDSALAPKTAMVSFPDASATDEKVARKGPQTPQELIRVRSDLLDRLVNNAGEVSIYRSRLEQQMGTFRFNLEEFDQTVSRLREQLRKMEIETENQILSRYQREPSEPAIETDAETEGEFDPLELDRFSQIQQLSRALAESVSDLVSIQGFLDDLTRESETLLLQQSRVTSDLQEGLMRTRMVPFDSLVPRLRRILRQTSSDLSKKAQLKVSGAQGEMDRTVLERMTAPLEHMLRNAVAHGIEDPTERVKSDKAETGMISINVSRDATEVVIQVADDGAGINVDTVRRKAIERGLLREDAALSDRDIYTFILESGFSTAESVNKVAGRGVGMDVVASEIKQVGGSLEIDSVDGKGTVFTIRLPFTLAVAQAIMVRVQDNIYAVPLSSVVGVVRMERPEFADRVRDGQTVYPYAGDNFQMQELNILLGLGGTIASDEEQIPILMIRTGGQRAAVRVDQVLGSREIVVKSVGPQISSVPGIFGASILGDGRVVLILDPGPLLRRGVALQLAPESAEVATDAAQARQRPLVMVVDDSITMRKVTTRVLERNDMEVVTAKDGVDAVAALQERIPDLMLLDIEMPRMDGYELATHMRNDARLKGIPIIMITSRTGDKHRKRALEIGVDRYLGKPYQEAELLDTVKVLLGAEVASG